MFNKEWLCEIIETKIPHSIGKDWRHLFIEEPMMCAVFAEKQML
jgi:hypothetical protein